VSKNFEINKSVAKAGRVPFKQIIHKIYPDENSYNLNGISWNRQYTEQNKDSVNGMCLVCQFLDKDNQIPFGSHGDAVIKDGDVSFDDSLVVGTFEDSYIDDALELNGETFSALVGQGYIYSQRFPALVDYLQEQYDQGNSIDGSVEICADKSKGNNQIVYANGYKENGRIPKEYQYSGNALCIGVPPADSSAVMIELNNAKKMHSQELDKTDSFEDKNKNNEEVKLMDENAIKQLVSDIKDTVIEVNSKNADYEEKLNKVTEENVVLTETNAKNEETIKAKDTEIVELNEKITNMTAELNESKKTVKVNELNKALADYSDEQKDFAKTEIEAFNADPMAVEVNSVVDKILVEIGKKSIESAKIAETNSKKEDVKLDDIFGDILETNSKENEEVSIF